MANPLLTSHRRVTCARIEAGIMLDPTFVKVVCWYDACDVLCGELGLRIWGLKKGLMSSGCGYSLGTAIGFG